MSEEDITQIERVKSAIDAYYKDEPIKDFVGQEELVQTCDMLLSIVEIHLPNWREIEIEEE